MSDESPDGGSPEEGSLSPYQQDQDKNDAPVCNPEPPAELVEKHLIDADNIGNTVFSKHWLFTVLMKLIEAVENVKGDEDDPETEPNLDLDDKLQDELCELWDMSMNSDEHDKVAKEIDDKLSHLLRWGDGIEVVTFLQEFKALDILTGAIRVSKLPRATEICVGILGNMACDKKICREMAESKTVKEIIFVLLGNTDAPTLVETTRLLHVCLSTPEAQEIWISNITSDDEIFDQVLFILQSSTNKDLLKNVAEFVDKVMDIDDNLCSQWSTPQLIRGVLEAIKQIGSLKCENLDIFLHILQLMSTCEAGVSSLVAQAEEVSGVMLHYVRALCEEEVLVVDGQETAIAAVMSTLSALITTWPDRNKLLVEDYHLLRCVMKFSTVVSERRHIIKKKVEANTENGIEENINKEKEDEDDYDHNMTIMLYDLIQNQLIELVKLISAFPEPQEDSPNPKCFEYLENLCPHERLHNMVEVLVNAGHRPLVDNMLQSVQLYSLTRTHRVLTESLSNITTTSEVTDDR